MGKIFTPHPLLSLRSRLVSPRHSDGTEHEHTSLTEDEVNLSISNIAAQLLSDPPEGSVASAAENPNYQPHTENQAKVVDHIKGLLNDIVTNTLVDGESEDKLFVVDMQSEEKNARPTENTPFTPTILQTMYSLDTNTIKDKETIVKIINSMKANEKEAAGENRETTTYVSIFETTAKPENDEERLDGNETTEKLMMDGDILGQYIAAYDANTEDESVAVKSVSTTTTTSTTTTSTTTSATTTASTTSTTRTTTSTTTSTTTTTTPVPTLIERAGSFVSGGIGGIVNGLANVGNVFSAATRPFWLPLGRKRRNAGEEGTDKAAIFKRFLTFKKKLKAMDQEKLDEIIRGVVEKVMRSGPNNMDIAGVDSELMTQHISKILLRQKDISSKKSSFDVPDSSVSANDL